MEATTGALIAAVIVTLVAIFMVRRPKKIGKPWSLPWHGILFLSILVAILMINHLATLQKTSATPLF